jgi:N-acetylmuramoyl-L-alanine amidase
MYGGDGVSKRAAARRLGWLRPCAVACVVGLALVPAVASAGAPKPVTNILEAGGALQPGKSLVSRNGHFRLTMVRDGNLVLYHGTRRVWSSGTSGRSPVLAKLHLDGMFTVYNPHWTFWKSPAYVNHKSAAYVVLEDDGNIVICNHRNKPLWSLNRPPTLQEGATGNAVLALQRRLNALGYWVGPLNGIFGDSTQQAVWAAQKAAVLPRDGVAGTQTWRALERHVVPKARPASGNLIEVNLADDLLMIIRGGRLRAILNTSTGGGYTYVDNGVTSVAITPQGVFHTYAEIDGIDVDSLGTLWRPKFFTSGYAIHGDSYVPPYPVSHGCVRVSNEAIDWIWAENFDPIGTEVWVYS